MKLSAIAPLLMALAAITSANPLEERAEETAVTGAPDEASANVEADPEIKAASRPINLVVWKKPNFTGERVQLHPPSGACRKAYLAILPLSVTDADCNFASGNFKPGLDNAVSSLNTNGAVCRFWKYVANVSNCCCILRRAC